MEKDPFMMSDEELEQAFLAAKAEMGSPDTQYEADREDEADDDLEQPVDDEDSDNDADADESDVDSEADSSEVDS